MSASHATSVPFWTGLRLRLMVKSAVLCIPEPWPTTLTELGGLSSSYLKDMLMLPLIIPSPILKTVLKFSLVYFLILLDIRYELDEVIGFCDKLVDLLPVGCDNKLVKYLHTG
jgi:hypothetical protein